MEPIIITTTQQPEVHTYKFTFDLITAAIMNDFIDLLNACMGGEVRIIDEYSVVHNGYIATPVNEIITGKTNCDYSIMFEFFKVV